MYCLGAVRNAEVAATVYPGWVCRFYVGRDVADSIILKLKNLPNTEIYLMREPSNWTATLWRCHAIGDELVDVLISRDTDSRPSKREKAAVDEWLASDKIFHIMRDHPWHTKREILGGMWGCIPKHFRRSVSSIDQFAEQNARGADDRWLLSMIYPSVKDKLMVHDEFLDKKPFPTPREGLEYVGEPVNGDDTPCDPTHREALRQALER